MKSMKVDGVYYDTDTIRDMEREIAWFKARTDKVQALVEALREGVNLIKGDKIASEWKRGCADFVRTANAALAAFTDGGTQG